MSASTSETDVPAATGPLGAAPAHVASRPEATTGLAARFLALDDFDIAARKHLPRMIYGYVAGGCETGAALRGNLASFAAHALVPRVLIDTVPRAQTTSLWGKTYAAPFGVAPMGALGLSAYRGDIVLAEACAAANVPMVLSAASLYPLEEVARAGARWYQAYLPADDERIDRLVDRVAAAGFEVFVLTADVPVAANRENNVRNGFSVPLQPSVKLVLDGLTHPRWLLGTALRTLRTHGIPHFENMDATRGPPVLARDVVRAVGDRDRLTWAHVARIRRRWSGRFVIKGILSPADAVLAREAGVDGIIVSNHGGRQLDGAAIPLDMLPAIKAVAGDMKVMIDGGIRRGTDVLKALALGADFAFVGRPFTYAAALGGATLAARAVALLKEEIDRDMALLGVTTLAEIGPAHVRPARGSEPNQP